MDDDFPEQDIEQLLRERREPRQPRNPPLPAYSEEKRRYFLAAAIVLGLAGAYGLGMYWKHLQLTPKLEEAAKKARQEQLAADKEANKTYIHYSYMLNGDTQSILFTSTAYTRKKLIRRENPKLHFADTVDDDDVITFLTNLVCKDVTTSAEKTMRIMDFATQNTRYIDDTFGDAPKFPVETLLEGGGDCEDLSGLTSSMLKAAHVSHGLLDHHREGERHVAVAVSFDENPSLDYFPDLKIFGDYLRTRPQFTVNNAALERDIQPKIYLNPNSFPRLDDLLTEAYKQVQMGRRAYSKITTPDGREVSFSFALIPKGQPLRGAYFPFTNGDALQVRPIHLQDTYDAVARNLAGCSNHGDFSQVAGKDKIVAADAYNCLLSLLQDQEQKERAAEEKRKQETEKPLPPGGGVTFLAPPVAVRGARFLGDTRYRDDGMWGLGKRFYVLEPGISQDKGNWRFSSNPADSGFDTTFFIPIVE